MLIKLNKEKLNWYTSTLYRISFDELIKSNIQYSGMFEINEKEKDYEIEFCWSNKLLKKFPYFLIRRIYAILGFKSKKTFITGKIIKNKLTNQLIIFFKIYDSEFKSVLTKIKEIIRFVDIKKIKENFYMLVYIGPIDNLFLMNLTHLINCFSFEHRILGWDSPEYSISNSFLKWKFKYIPYDQLKEDGIDCNNFGNLLVKEWYFLDLFEINDYINNFITNGSEISKINKENNIVLTNKKDFIIYFLTGLNYFYKQDSFLNSTGKIKVKNMEKFVATVENIEEWINNSESNCFRFIKIYKLNKDIVKYQEYLNLNYWIENDHIKEISILKKHIYELVLFIIGKETKWIEDNLYLSENNKLIGKAIFVSNRINVFVNMKFLNTVFKLSSNIFKDSNRNYSDTNILIDTENKLFKLKVDNNMKLVDYYKTHDSKIKLTLRKRV